MIISFHLILSNNFFLIKATLHTALEYAEREIRRWRADRLHSSKREVHIRLTEMPNIIVSMVSLFDLKRCET